MLEFWQILNGMILFFNTNVISLLWIVFAFYLLYVIKKNKSGSQWLQAQFEWMKRFFDEGTTDGNKPSHKNLISLSIVAVFCVAFLKKVVTATDVPDIQPGWQLVLLGILGIRAAQGAIEKIANSKYSADASRNGNGNGNNVEDNVDPKVESNKNPSSI